MDTTPPPGTQLLYDAAPCGLLLAGADGVIVHANATACRLLQYECDELVGQRRFTDLLTMGGRIFHQTHLAPLLRMQGSVAEVKLELRRKDGSSVPVMANIRESAYEGRLYLHAAVIVAEDRHKYERELLLQRQRAEQLLAQHERDQLDLAATRAQAEDRALVAEHMVGIVSHDLRNPLSTIQMSATLLGMGQLTEQQRTVLARITRSVQRSERLISDLLDFTQARLGGGIKVAPAEVDLHQVAADAVGDLRAAFAEREIVHRGEGPGQWHADADRVAQALGNLVANAVNYGDPSRPVTVTTAGGEGGFTLSVHNEGPPIPAEQAARLFEAMVRGDAATGSRGVGLGLYIVREIARAHGGSVDVDSAQDRGTTFRLRLAARDGPAADSPAA
ncbi:PAS domain-containing sensor histidine kinase [Ramlibacter sp.]|uniref:PAS domain-containing sensor histidine kinase n=1 Tax=Ramlibacter sp. TaxID=1917967 RepID=UPI003D0BB797